MLILRICTASSRIAKLWVMAAGRKLFLNLVMLYFGTKSLCIEVRNWNSLRKACKSFSHILMEVDLNFLCNNTLTSRVMIFFILFYSKSCILLNKGWKGDYKLHAFNKRYDMSELVCLCFYKLPLCRNYFHAELHYFFTMMLRLWWERRTVV